MVISENSVFVLFQFEADFYVESPYNVLYHFLFHNKCSNLKNITYPNVL